MKRALIYLIMGLLFLMGAVLVIYPLASNALYERNQSRVLSEYDKTVAQTEQNTLLDAMEAANAYNENLRNGGVSLLDPFDDPESLNEDEAYSSMLTLSENGIMGYLEIPRLQMYLPIYPGTSSDVLSQGVGHLQGSSLPVGGVSTHAVLTGHTGMAGKRMFTDLTEMDLEDVFYVHVLGQSLAYQVERIDIVEPKDTELLAIQPEKDLVTLVTCYPYGINTQRLLVQGSRIPYDPTQMEAGMKRGMDQSESLWRREYQKAVIASVAVYAPLTGIVLLVLLRRKRKRT